MRHHSSDDVIKGKRSITCCCALHIEYYSLTVWRIRLVLTMWKSWWYNRLCRQRSAVEADLEDTGEPMDGGSQKPGTGKDLGNTELMGQDGRSSERSDRRSLTAGRNAQSSQPSAAKFFTACLLFQGKCRKKQGNKAKCCRDEVPLMNIFQCPHDRDTVLVCPEPCIQDVQVKLAPVVDNQEEKGPHHCVVPSPPCSYGQVKQWHISQLHEQDMVLHIEIWDFGRDCGPPYYIAIWELTEGSRQVAWRTWIPRTLFEDSSKRKELEAFKAELDSEQEQKTLDTEQAQQIKLKERQKFFEEAFQQDMEQYLSAGYLQITERREPIGSMSSMEVNVDMLEQMDLMDMSDQEALDVFLNSGGEDNSAASPMLGQEPEPFPPTEITLQVPTQAELRHKLSSPSSSCKDSGSQAAGECPAAQRDGAPPERGVAVQPDDSNSRAT